MRSLLGVLLVAAAGLHWGGTSAATAAAGAAAIAGATALQDSPRGRIPLVVAVSAVMGGAVLLALPRSRRTASCSPRSPRCGASQREWRGRLSSNAGLIAAAASALLVTLPPTEPSWSGVATATALAVAGGLVQAALVAIWPRRRWRVQRDALARAYRALAADARSMADDPTGHVEPRAPALAAGGVHADRCSGPAQAAGLPGVVRPARTDLGHADRDRRQVDEWRRRLARVGGRVRRPRWRSPSRIVHNARPPDTRWAASTRSPSTAVRFGGGHRAALGGATARRGEAAVRRRVTGGRRPRAVVAPAAAGPASARSSRRCAAI